ncbi:MAG: response regulator [Elusimicrobia bacterium]|nr:response regulator [Elusimicrobiota bacterium]
MSKKVLIIDDELSLANMIKDHLLLKGYTVDIASNGKEGIEMARRTMPDAILLDILMPDMDGFETLKNLKKDVQTASIPVILDSIVGDYRAEAIQMGAVDFFSKPLNISKLIESVENITRMKEDAGKAIMVIDDDADFVQLTRDSLESKNFRVIGAGSGREGLEILRREEVGLIILDLLMPEMNGYEFIRTAKKDPATAKIPIIVVTHVDLRECRDKCLMLGVKECFSKPFVNRDAILDELKKLMDKMTEEKMPDQKKESAGVRILVADDEEIILELVRDTLESQGYEVIVAHDGREALEQIYAHKPDVLLLDVKMPFLTGYEVCEKIREDILMSNIPIIMLTAKTSEQDEIKGLESGVDDYMTKPFRPAILLARIRSVLARVKQGMNVNPLTYLPGNTMIIKEIERRLKRDDEFAVLYLDIDRFKAFNDYYGFERGDEIIKAVAKIIVDAVKKHDPGTGFVGHIGGDDYICVISDAKTDDVCRNIIEEFDKTVTSYYNEEDRKKGYILTEDRKGCQEKFPIMAVSIGVVSSTKKTFYHVGEISKIGAELKKYAKKDEKSNYVIDRRSY